MELSISGIYNPESIQLLKQLDINHFGFDLRPLSVNFLQEYKLHQILNSHIAVRDKIFLQFENEKNFVIEKIVTDLRKNSSIQFLQQVSLVFSDTLGTDFYDQFEVPYFWHFKTKLNYQDFLQSIYCEGLIFELKDLADWFQDGSLYSFFKILDEQNLKQKKYILRVPVESHIPESMLDFLHFDSVELAINKNVEISYRNINLEQLKTVVQGHRHYLTII